jgi:hypothetical protein
MPILSGAPGTDIGSKRSDLVALEREGTRELTEPSGPEAYDHGRSDRVF